MLDWLKPILGDGYNEEIDNKIAAEINKGFVAKADYDAAKDAQRTAAEALADANKALAEYKDTDIDGLRKSAEEWQAKAEQAEKDADARCPAGRTAPCAGCPAQPAKRRCGGGIFKPLRGAGPRLRAAGAKRHALRRRNTASRRGRDAARRQSRRRMPRGSGTRFGIKNRGVIPDEAAQILRGRHGPPAGTSDPAAG